MKRSRWFQASVLALAVVLMSAGIALADDLENSVQTGGPNVREAVRGGSLSVDYWINQEKDPVLGETGPGACNASVANPLSVDLTAPTGITPNPDPLSIDGCGTSSSNFESVSFDVGTSAALGDNAITHALTPSTGYDNQANFQLRVLPRAATNPVASSTGATSVDFTWDRSADHADIVRYLVLRSSGGPYVQVGDPTKSGLTGTTQTFSDSGLTEAIQYCYKVVARYSVAPSHTQHFDSAESAAGCATPQAVIAQNSAPQVDSAAADASGIEGDTLSTSGSFSDPDGDALVITANNTVGTFTDNGDGTWDWSLATNDDVASTTITVTATDLSNATATDEFDYSAANADPALSALSVTPADATGCDIDLDFTFTDAGSADTHEGSVDWENDGTADETFTSSPSTDPAFSHSYSSAGSYTIAVYVEDDDGGSDSDTTTNDVYNSTSGVLQPINAAGGSNFKRGSVIPVKIKVYDCDGGVVDDLAPTIDLVKKAAANGDVNEAPPAASADPGNIMRWDPNGMQYIFNLSTKRSVFNGGADLLAGGYELTINDPSFLDVDVCFDLVR